MYQADELSQVRLRNTNRFALYLSLRAQSNRMLAKWKDLFVDKNIKIVVFQQNDRLVWEKRNFPTTSWNRRFECTKADKVWEKIILCIFICLLCSLETLFKTWKHQFFRSEGLPCCSIVPVGVCLLHLTPVLPWGRSSGSIDKQCTEPSFIIRAENSIKKIEAVQGAEPCRSCFALQ